MKLIFKYLKPYRKGLATVALLHAVATFASLLMPYVMSLIVDEGIGKENRDIIVFSAIAMLALALISLVTALLSNKLNARLTTGFSYELLSSCYKEINTLSPEQYSKIGSSGLLTRATDDVFNLEGAAVGLVSSLVTVPIMLIGGTILSFSKDVMLSLIFLASVPLVLILTVLFVRPLDRLWDKSDRYVDEQNRIVRERLSGLRVVRAFNSEAHEHKRAKRATEEMAHHIIRANVFAGFAEPLGMLILNFAVVVMLAVGGYRAGEGLLGNAGDVISVIQYVALISNALIMLSWTMAWIPKLKVSAKRISEIFDMPKEDVGADDVLERELSNDGAVLELCKVGFTYPDARREALSDISLRINQGERVAIIGGTGSGKTTLIRLILGLYSATEGEIYLNSEPYSALGKGAVRSAFSATLQGAMIFEGSLGDNMNMGSEGAEEAKLLEAASICELDSFISSHEEGLGYTLVGMGRNISGGQKQRVTMTRCVMKDAPIYIFDDSFSALDYLTERKIQGRLRERLKGKTVITVTQRVSTALAADRIFVMDGGRIVAEGSHEELLRNSDIYREIAESQLGKGAVGGEA